MAVVESHTLKEYFAEKKRLGWEVIHLPTFLRQSTTISIHGEYDFAIKCGARKVVAGHSEVLKVLPYFNALANFKEGNEKTITLNSAWDDDAEVTDAFFSSFFEKFLDIWYLRQEVQGSAVGRALLKQPHIFSSISSYFGLGISELQIKFDKPVPPLPGLMVIHELASDRYELVAQSILSRIAGEVFYSKNMTKCHELISGLKFDYLEYLLSCEELRVPSESCVLDCVAAYVKANSKKLGWLPNKERYENLFSLHEGVVTPSMYKKIQFLRNKIGDSSLFQRKSSRKRQRWPKAMGMVSYCGMSLRHHIGYFSINEIDERDSSKSRTAKCSFQSILEMPASYDYRFDACTGSGDFIFCTVAKVDNIDAFVDNLLPSNSTIHLYCMHIDLPLWTRKGVLKLPFVPHRPSLTVFNDKLYLIGGVEGRQKRTIVTKNPEEKSSPRVFTYPLRYEMASGERLSLVESEWTEVRNLNIGRGGHSIVDIGGELLVTGGAAAGMTATPTAEVCGSRNMLVSWIF